MKHLLTACMLGLVVVINCYGSSPSFPTKPLILAHRAGSGLWIANAVSNVLKEMAAGGLKGRIHGIEVDIALTKDKVPVISHDPWVNEMLCTLADGTPVSFQLIKDIDYADLLAKYRCGGVSDPEFPSAQTHNEPILGFDELLALIKPYPEIIVYLDLKIQEPYTPGAKDFADAVFSRMQQTAISNSFNIEGPTANAITALQDAATVPFVPVLSYPPFYAKENWTLVGAWTKLRTLLNPSRPIEEAAAAGVKAIASPRVVLSDKARQLLHEKGITVISFTPNTAEKLQDECESPVSLIITDYPNLGPCN